MNNVQKVDDLLDFSTEGLVCLLAMELLGLRNLSGSPDEAPDDRMDKEALSGFLKDVSMSIVNFVKPSIEFKTLELEEGEIEKVTEKVAITFCSCETSLEYLDGMQYIIIYTSS